VRVPPECRPALTRFAPVSSKEGARSRHRGQRPFSPLTQPEHYLFGYLTIHSDSIREPGETPQSSSAAEPFSDIHSEQTGLGCAAGLDRQVAPGLLW